MHIGARVKYGIKRGQGALWLAQLQKQRRSQLHGRRAVGTARPQLGRRQHAQHFEQRRVEHGLLRIVRNVLQRVSSQAS